MAREIVVHLSDGSALSVSKEHEAELNDALTKGGSAVTLRDSTGARVLVNVSHIIRVELRP
jgi:hypothetical protein